MQVAVLPINSHAVEQKDMHDIHDIHIGYGYGFTHEPSPTEFAWRTQDYLTRFWGFAKLSLSFPDIVENALSKGVKSLESILPPFMWISKRGHGDIGAVFLIKDIKKEELYQEGDGTESRKFKEYLFGRNNNVVARVSYGPGTSEITQWEPNQIGRLHIGAYGIRKFSPVDENSDIAILNPQFFDKNDCLTEEVYLSLRWVKNKGQWQFDNPYGEFCETPETRLTWMRLRKREYNMETVGHKSQNLVPFAPELNDFGQPKKRTEPSIAEQMNNLETTHSGYEPVLRLLAQFGSVHGYDNVAEMSPEQGVDYLFGKVVPAMVNFSRA